MENHFGTDRSNYFAWLGRLLRIVAFDNLAKSPLKTFRATTPGVHVFVLAILSAIILFANLHRGDLSGYDDAVYAHEAKIVLQTGDWFTLRLNGYPDFDKPPLFVWLVALSFKVLGVSDYAAKFPAALFGYATILLVYFLSKHLSLDRWIPVLSMLVLMSTQYFLKYSMHAMTGVPFTFFFTLAIYFYIRSQRDPRYLLMCGSAVGLATMTVSPMGLFPLGIIGLHLVFTKRFNLLFSRYWAGCLLLSFMLPMIWYVKEYQLYGNEFLVQHFANLLNHAIPAQAKTYAETLAWHLEYPILLLKHYWPWLPFMVFGLIGSMKKALTEKAETAALLCLWVLSVVILFSLADSKVLRYILPAFPAFSILAAMTLNSLVARHRKAFFKWSYAILSMVVLIATVFPNYRVRAGDMRALAPVVKTTAAHQQRILLYTFGQYQWDYRNKLLWYGDRLCRHLLTIEAVSSLLECDPYNIAIINREALAELTDRLNGRVQIIGESKRFVCVRSYFDFPNFK